MTKLVNKYKTTEDFIYIGRGTQAGNPFIVGIDGDNAECVEKYSRYFYWRISWDIKFLDYIHSLKGKTIGCTCLPKPCHGSIIIKYLLTLVE